MTTGAGKVAVITGAGSGIGRAITIKLSESGWTVALLGRRKEPLEALVARIGDKASAHSVDVSDAEAVNPAVEAILQRHGRIDALVLCAGINVPNRSWKDLTTEDYNKGMRINLDGAFNCIHAVYPTMKARGSGSIVAINSEAGMKATDKAGVPYNASKFGLAGLIQSINAEERANGIRACSIFPGDVNTPLLDKRPSPPPEDQRAKMVQPEDVARCVALALELPARAIIEELVIRPAY